MRIKGVDNTEVEKYRHHESFEKLFKQFKRDVEREGIIREIKKREFYEKPSQLKRRKKVRKYRPQIF
jgi:small subunit ribosomal protein S21